MTDGDASREEGIIFTTMSKVEMAKIVGNIGMVVFDVTASKLAVKKADAAATTSWELITSVQDS